MSKDTEDLRDRFFNELTRKRTDGVTDFNCLPHAVFEWIKDNAHQLSENTESLDIYLTEMGIGTKERQLIIAKFEQYQSPVTDEDVLNRVIMIRRADRTESAIFYLKQFISDLQPKTDDWVSVVKKQIKELKEQKGETLDSFLDADMLQQDILSERNMRISMELTFLKNLLTPNTKTDNYE